MKKFLTSHLQEVFHSSSGVFGDLGGDLLLRRQRCDAWQAGRVLNKKKTKKTKYKTNLEGCNGVQPLTCHLFRKWITSMKVFLMSHCRFSGLSSSSTCTVKVSSSSSSPAYDADSDMNAASEDEP